MKRECVIGIPCCWRSRFFNRRCSLLPEEVLPAAAKVSAFPLRMACRGEHEMFCQSMHCAQHTSSPLSNNTSYSEKLCVCVLVWEGGKEGGSAAAESDLHFLITGKFLTRGHTDGLKEHVGKETRYCMEKNTTTTWRFAGHVAGVS